MGHPEEHCVPPPSRSLPRNQRTFEKWCAIALLTMTVTGISALGPSCLPVGLEHLECVRTLTGI